MAGVMQPASESNANSEQRGELELVRRLRTMLGQPGGARVAFGDDMCQLVPDDDTLLGTVDMLMDGVDFDSREHSWEAIGRKAMAVNLSDCAAMAVVPVSALCAVALNANMTMDAAVELHRGAHEFGLRYACPIVGGDTNSWPAPTAISISITARVAPGTTPVRRNGGLAGVRIFVTGPSGGSILGRHMTFEPRVELALDISRRLRPHAMIDISDGLALDLGRVLTASGCGAVLDEAALEAVIHPDARLLAERDGRSPRDHTLHDGEDFELIVVLPAEVPDQDWRPLGLLPIGRVASEEGLFLEHADGQRAAIPMRGWEHFK